MVILYLDMDGVVADFDYFQDKWVSEQQVVSKQHHENFKKMITEDKVFEQLPLQEGAVLLMSGVHELLRKYPDLVVQFLTSVGTKELDLGSQVQSQKINWLRKNGMPFHVNFVTEKKEKARYADKKSILVDDRPGCVDPFREAGGRAILHKDAHVTLQALEEHVDLLSKM